jgi:hypothetical protein
MQWDTLFFDMCHRLDMAVYHANLTEPAATAINFDRLEDVSSSQLQSPGTTETGQGNTVRRGSSADETSTLSCTYSTGLQRASPFLLIGPMKVEEITARPSKLVVIHNFLSAKELAVLVNASARFKKVHRCTIGHTFHYCSVAEEVSYHVKAKSICYTVLC